MAGMVKRTSVLFVLAFLVSCGSGHLSGTYTPQASEETPVQSLTFHGDEVDVQYLIGPAIVSKYHKDGNRLEISANGQTQAWTIDANGCVGADGVGLFCKSH